MVKSSIVSIETEIYGNRVNYLADADEEQEAKRVVNSIVRFVKPITYFFFLYGIKIESDLKDSETFPCPFWNNLGIIYRTVVVAVLLLAHLVSCARVIILILAYQNVEITFAEKLYSTIQICFFCFNLVTYMYILFNRKALSILLTKITTAVGKLIHGSSRKRHFIGIFRNRIAAFLGVLGTLIVWKTHYLMNTLVAEKFRIIQSCVIAAPSVDMAICIPVEVVFIFDSVALFIFFLASIILLLIFLVLLKFNFEIIEENRYYVSKSTILGNQLDQFLTCHRAACKRVKHVNGLFSCLILMWMFSEIFDIIISFGAVTKAPSVQMLICYIFILTLLSASFLTKFFLISSINSKILTTLDCVYVDESFGDQLSYIKYEQSMFYETKQYFHMYCTRLDINTPCLSGCGFFKIDRRLLMTVACLVLSYSFLLQDIDEKQQLKG